MGHLRKSRPASLASGFTPKADIANGNESRPLALIPVLLRQESSMRWTPSIVPKGHDETVYLVLDDFGRRGRAYRETDVERTDLEAVINDLMTGQYNNPVTVVAFNLAEGWANDVSEDIAHEIQNRADLAGQDLTSSIEDFVQRYAGRERQLALRLA
jgi:hypothetical protein